MTSGYIHGHSKPRSSTYQSWHAARRRCNSSKNTRYKDYGGRGIKMCARWDDFALFLEDMGARPEGTSLDRIDNNGNYEPGNCRWATEAAQKRNMRVNQWVIFKGRRLTITDVASELGQHQTTIIKAAQRRGLTYQQIVSHYEALT